MYSKRSKELRCFCSKDDCGVLFIEVKIVQRSLKRQTEQIVDPKSVAVELPSPKMFELQS